MSEMPQIQSHEAFIGALVAWRHVTADYYIHRTSGASVTLEEWINCPPRARTGCPRKDLDHSQRTGRNLSHRMVVQEFVTTPIYKGLMMKRGEKPVSSTPATVYPNPVFVIQS